jgi:hypothetical protein
VGWTTSTATVRRSHQGHLYDVINCLNLGALA